MMLECNLPMHLRKQDTPKDGDDFDQEDW